MNIRWMMSYDLPQVMEIEKLLYENPPSKEEFLVFTKDSVNLVAESAGEVKGFISYRLHSSGFEIRDIAVHPHYQRQGVATQIVGTLKLKLTQQKRHSIFLTLFESALSAQLFFKSLGFEWKETLKGRHPITGEDAYRFAYSVSTYTNRITKFLEMK